MATADSSGTAPACATETLTTIPLATDVDFAAAEAELVRLLAEADETLKTTPDDKWPEVQAQWWAYHEALLTAEPRTPLQAAIVLRRVLCQHCGLPSGSNDMNLPAITRVAGFLGAGHSPSSDAELLTLAAEFNVAESEFLAASETEEGRAADARAAAAARKIAAMPARTFPGLVAKIKVLAADADITEGADWTKALIRGVAADAERLVMPGRAAV